MRARTGRLAEAYFVLGDALWKWLGELSGKDRDLLDERIRRTRLSRSTAAAGLDVDGRATGSPAPPADCAVNTLAPNIGRFRLELDKLGFPPLPPTHVALPPLEPTADILDGSNDDNVGTPGRADARSTDREHGDAATAVPPAPAPSTVAHPEPAGARPTPAMPVATMELRMCVLRIMSDDLNASLAALGTAEAALGDASAGVASLAPLVDPIVDACVSQLRAAFERYMVAADRPQELVIRLSKHLLSVLVHLVGHAKLATAISPDALKRLISELLWRLLDEHLTQLPEGPNFLRALNALMLRVLEASDRTAAFGVLLRCLQEGVSIGSDSRYVELVMKCLWKLTKALDAAHASVNAEELLGSIQLFFTAHPPATWRDSAPGADMPLRTVKTILHTMAKLRGSALLQCVGKCGPDSYVEHYLHQMLAALSRTTAAPGDGTDGADAASPTNAASTPLSSGPVRPSAPTLIVASDATHTPLRAQESLQALNRSLTGIFKKIGTREQTRLGLEELYDFLRQHPEADIKPFLSRTSEFFQGYIRRGLDEIAQDRARRSVAAHEPHAAAPPAVPASPTASVGR